MTTDELLKTSLKTSLKHLCTRYLGYKDWDRVHDDIERFLLRAARRKLILVPRGHLKTAIITKGYTVQALLKNPNARVLIANQVWDKAREMLYEIKELLTNKSELPKIFGAFESNRWTADDIVISQRTQALAAASISTTGVEAETTSSHYDLIILDDIQGLQNFQTPDQREKVKRFYRSMIDLLEQDGQIIIPGTRWHMDDVYQHIMDTEKDYFEIMVRKVVENGRIIFPRKFAKRFDSHRRDWVQAEDTCMDFIDYLKASKGSEYYSQYENNPIDEANQLFKKQYFKYWNTRPENLHVCMTIDLAIGQKQENDYTAIIVAGKDKNHNIYVLDYLRGHWRPSDVVDNIFQMREKWQPHVVGMEVNGFQRTLQYGVEEEMRKRKNHFYITEIKNTQNSKEFRIKALEPYYRNNAESLKDEGKIYHAAWMKEKDLEDELLAFPKARHDDLADSLSFVLNLLSPGIGAAPYRMKEGTWEAVEYQARLNNQPYRGFFDYGR